MNIVNLLKTTLTSITILANCNFLFSQTFNATGGAIPDNSALTTCFQFNVTGIGTIDGSFGLTQICVDIDHTWDSDLDFYLLAPDGTTVALSSDNGGSGNDYDNTCFDMSAGTSITAGAAPFNGTYIPEGLIGNVNNGQNANGTWELCITDDAGGDVGTLNSWSLTFGNNPPAPPAPPANDDPCNSANLNVSSNCTYNYTYSNMGATSSTGVPAPGCGNYSGGDIWFTATVPASGAISVDTDTDQITNADIAIYSGTCNSLTLLDCDDFQSSNGSMGQVTLQGLTPGSTIFIRVWENGNDSFGTFGICVTDPPVPPACGGNPAAGNDCSSSPVICDLDGICGSTAASYTPNYWTQLNNEFCGSIENNSFIAFVSDGQPLSLEVFITNCLGGANDAIQFMLFTSTGNCSGNVTDLSCLSPMYQSSSPVTFTASGLTNGETYYLMIDGWAGDVCDYAISANSGVSIPVDAGTDVTICEGESTTLNALNGDGTNYAWDNGAGSGSTVSVSPTTTTTYTVTSPSGNPLCGIGNTTDQVTVTVAPVTQAGIDANSAISGDVGPSFGDANSGNTIDICNGGSATLTAIGTGTIAWSPSTGLSSTTAGTVTASPTTTTTYTLTTTSGNGCTSTASITVNVAPAPTVTINSGTICDGDNITLTASGMNSYSWSPATGLSGTTGASVTASPTTTTTYTVTGSTTGCPNDTETSTVTVTPLPVPNFSITGDQCVATNNVTFNNTGTVGTHNWTVTSGTPGTGTGNSITSSFGSAGTYNITLSTTTNGCTDAITIPVTINPNPTVTITPTPISCNGDCDGILLAAGAGTSGYSYTWDNGLGSGDNPTGVCAGTYTVTVQDINGCEATATETLTDPTLLTINASGTDPLCNGDCDGTLTSNGAGGTGALTYSWTGGVTGQNPTGVCDGTYTVTVEDNNNCTATADVTLSEPTLLTLTASATDATCNTACDGTLTSTGAGGTGALTYSWTGGVTGQNPIGVCDGSYTVTVEDDNNCTATASVTVSEPTQIVPSIVTQTNVLCNGASTGSVTIGATGSSGNYNYNIGAGAQASGTFTGLSAGSYTITVSDAANAACSETINVTITEPTPLTATIAPVTLNCNGDCDGQATVTTGGGSGNYDFSWDNATFDTGSTTTANLCSGTYNVTVADQSDPTCTVNASITVTEPTVISLSESTTPANCGATDGDGTVSATGGTGTFVNYTWSPAPGSGQGTATATGLAAGSYNVVVEDGNGCTNNINVVVANNTAPSISEIIGSHVDVDCNGNSTGEAEVSATGGTGTLDYSWAPSGGTNNSATGLSADTYTVTVTDDNNCSDAVTITITEPTVINTVASVTSNVSCNGGNDGEALVNVSGGTPNYQYQWYDAANNPLAGETNASISGLSAGDYYVIITDNNTCTSTSNTITITEPIIVSGSGVETSVMCNGGSDGSIDLTPAGGDGSYNFAWTGPAGFTSAVEDPSGLTAGTYDVTITDGQGCTGTTSVTVTEPTVLTINLTNNDEYCGQANGDATATAGGGTIGYSYEWFDDAGLTNSVGTGSNISSLSGGTYYAEVTDANNCTQSQSVVINNIAGPTVTAALDNDASGPGICNGEGTAVGAGGTGTLSYTWDNSNTSATATDLCAGVNCVTVTDDEGCTATDCITINEPSSVTVVIVGTNLDCNGICNGEADVTASGGVGGYTYAWAHGPTAEDLTGLCAGTYDVIVTDNNGNTGTATVVITEPTSLSIDFASGISTLCNGSCDGEISSSASGGTGNISYEWFDNLGNSVSTSQNEIGICTGNYDIVVTDDNGCSTTQTLTVNEPAPLTGNTSAVNSNCNQADGEVSVTGNGGTVTGNYSYSWVDPGNSVIGNTSNITGLLAGSYAVTITDDNNCTYTEIVNVTDAGGGSLSETHINTNCNGSSDGSIDLSITGGTAPFSYSWSGPNGYTSNSEDITTISAGTYDVLVTDNVNCTATLTVLISEPTAVFVTPSSNPTNCFGSSDGEVLASAIGGTGAVTFEWFDDAIFNNLIGTGSPLNGLPANTYYVEGTDANGCTGNSSITVTEPDEILLTLSSTDANCGQSDGSVSIQTTTGGSGIYISEVWTDNLGNPVTNINAVSSGTYVVVVADDNGCSGTTNIGVNDVAGPSANIVSVASTSCNGLCDGTALVNVAGGTAGFTFNWTPAPTSGQGTLNAIGLCAGDYNFSVSDANGCVDNITVTVLEPAPLAASLDAVTDVSINGGSDGTADISATGGTPAYSYQWYSDCDAITAIAQTSTSASGLSQGSYGMVVTDAKGCTDTICATINEPTTINIVETIVDASCFGNCDGSISIMASGGVPGYTYNWFDNNNVAIGQTGTAATGLCSGEYYVIVTDQNGGSTTSINFNVGEPTDIVITTSVTSDFNGQQISCNGICDGIINASATGGNGPYTYLWDPNTGSSTNSTVNNVCEGSYGVTVTDVNGCTQSGTITITEPQALVNAPSQIDVSCNAACDGEVNTSITGGTGPYTYLWNDPTLSTTANVNGLCAGNFQASITDANGCSITESYSITEPQALVLDQVTQGSNCNQNDGSATVTVVSGDAPYSYLWDVNAGSVTTAAASSLFAGCYDVNVTDVNGCVETLNICVSDLGAPTVTILTQTDVSCNGGNDGFAQIQVTNGNPPYSYSWADCNGTTINQTTASAFNLTAGCFTGSMVDNVGCTGSVNVTIDEPTPLNTIIGNITDVTCFADCDGSATIVAAGGTAPYTYLWNDPAGQTASTASNLCPGTYTCLITDALGCTQSLDATIGEPSEIILSTSEIDAFCQTATGSSTVTITSGGIGTFSYLWTPSGQTSATLSNVTPGTYDVIVTDSDGCSQTTSTTVGDIPASDAIIGTISDVLCNGGNDGSIQVNVSGTGTAPYAYQWHDANTNSAISGQNSATAFGLPIGDYYVEVTDANGCLSVSNSGTINEPTAIVINNIVSDALCNGSCDGTANAAVQGGIQPYNYQWDDNLNQTTITASGLCQGTYNVTVTDDNGCIVSESANIGEPGIIVLDSTVTNANCGQPDGLACVSANGGTGGYNFLWPDGTTNTCASNLIAGTYIVDVTDANNCLQQISVEVSDLGGPVAEITGFTNVSCFAFCDGQATVDMTGGNGTNFTAQWDNNAGNQITPTASNLCAGVYAVTITDDLGCNASTSVTIGEPDIIQYNITEQNISCYNFCDGGAEITVIGGTQPYTYNWLDANNNGIGGNVTSVTNLCDDSYGVNVTDANGCTFTDNFTILQPIEVSGTTIPFDVNCFGACDGSASVDGVDGFAPFTYQWDGNANNQTGDLAQNLCPGTYNVTITDDNGCQGSTSVTVTEPTLLEVNINNFGNISCNSICDGFIEASVTGGTAPYTYLWDNNGGAAALATNLCAGNYNLTVTDANGCTVQIIQAITEPAPLSSSITGTDLTCFQSCDGTATIALAGGTAPYSYQWDNNNFNTLNSLTNECAGTYTCDVTDANGCQISETFTIGQPNTIISTSNISNSNCGQDNGQICTTTNGGTAPYSFQWNDPNTQTGACANNLLAGCYTLTVTDANACIMDTLYCVNDIAGPVVNVVDSTDVSCFGAMDGMVEFSVSGGTGLIIEQILDGNGNSINTSQTIATNLSGDCYTLIATDAAGCVGTDVICINEPNQLNAAVTNSSDALCHLASSGNATVSTNGGTSPYTYLWNSGTTPNDSFTEGLSAGTYTVNVTDNNNCTTSASIVIEEPLPIQITVVTSDVSCFAGSNGNIDLTITGGTPFYLYDWTPNISTTSNANLLLAGNYSVTITDANGCNQSESFTISEPTQLVAVVDNFSQPTCGFCNGEIEVSANGGAPGYTYSWMSGANPNSNLNIDLCPGFHDIEVTDANGCSVVITQELIDQASPIIDSIIYNSPLCNGLSNGSATVFASGVFDPALFSYSWDAAANNQNTSTAVALSDGLYCVTVTDPNGCNVTSCIDVIEPNALFAVPDGSDTICFGEETQIWASGQGGTAPYTINWIPNGLSGQGPILVSPTSSTDYCFTVTDANGCLSSQECVNIVVRDPLSLDLTPSSFICSNGSIDLTALASGGITTAYDFDWQDDIGSAIVDTQTGNESIVTVSPSNPTWYYVTLTDGCSNDVTDSTEIVISPSPVVFLSAVDSNGCEPFNAQFIGNSDIGVTYEYDIDCDGTYEYSGTNSNYGHLFDQEGIYDVCLNVISADGCSTTVSQQDFIQVYDLPIANFVADPQTTTFLTPYIEFIDGSQGAGYYYWDFGDSYIMEGDSTTVYDNLENSNGLITLPTHTFADTGYYTVELTTSNQYGCESSYEQTIYIEGDHTFYTPNAFTPDGDGTNDTFKPTGIGIDEDDYQFFIFNRWGQLIFEAYDPDIAWDGNYKNVLSQMDVYVWMVKTRDHEGNSKEYQGHVTLVR